MAKRNPQDVAAAKAKKQKIILIVGGVLLLAVAAIQVPKLMKGSGTTAAPPPAAVAVATPGTPTAAAAVAVVPTKGAVVVAGVSLPGTKVVAVERSQLASFTLFEAKDPFVQKVDENQGTDNGGTAQGGDAATTTTTPAPSASNPAPAASTPAPAPDPIVYATIDFNGKPQQVTVKDTFPASDPMFTLRSVGKKQAKISVAGGSFDGGKPLTLKLGKKVTLVNSATGVRYELKLVYTGSQPEVIEGFTTAPNTTSGSTNSGSTNSGSTVDAATATSGK